MSQSSLTSARSGSLAPEPAGYYSHSGEVPPAGIVAGLIVGLLVAGVGGMVYGSADHFIRFIYIRVLMTMAFGFVLGILPARAMLKANVRNTGAIIMMTLLTAVTGYYVSWAAWMWSISLEGRRPIPLQRFLASPPLMMRVILRLDKMGAWSIDRGSPINGSSLWAVWLIEAMIIFVIALATGRKTARKRPYCEKCGRWVDSPKVIAATNLVEPAQVREQLESRRFEFVSQLPRFNSNVGTFLLWDSYQCLGCQEFNTLTVTKVTITRDKRGRTHKRRRTIVDKLLVATPELERMKVKPIAPAIVPPPEAPLSAPPPTVVETPPLAQEPVPPPAPRGDDRLLDL